MEEATRELFAEFSSYIGVINLPTFDDVSRNLVGRDALISGFGAVNNDQDSSVLRFAETSIISNFKCSIFYWGLIKNSNICIGTWNGRSTCYGDSGKYFLHIKSLNF